MGIVYNLIFILFIIIYLPVSLFRRRRREGISQRLGIYPAELIERLKVRRNIWVHAVSVGEVMAALPVIERLTASLSEYNLVITTVTETGNSVAKKAIGKNGAVLYLPFDITCIARRALSLIRPSALIIVETELWPNLIREASRGGVPIILVNGRISPGSFKRYRLIKPLLKPVLRDITLYLMQTSADMEKIAFLGADPLRIRVSGNTKFDSAASMVLSDEEKRRLKSTLRMEPKEALLIAGSTHPGEEAVILSVYKKLKKKFNNLRLLIAPRHAGRAEEVEGLIRGLGLRAARISHLGASGEERKTVAGGRVFILDTVGELKKYYSVADIVFMGGSLIKRGGQNMIEPAVFAKPVLFGPHMFNFKDAAVAFLEKNAAIAVKNADALEEEIGLLLKDPVLRTEYGKRAKAVVDENRGSSDTIVGAVRELLKC